MRRKWMIVFVITLSMATVAISGITVASDHAIKLVVNGNILSPDVAPENKDGRIMVPVRWGAEALGADVSWDEALQTVAVNMPELHSLERQVELLRKGLAAKTSEEAVQKWAQAVQQRNGAVQFALLSPELQVQKRISFEELGWVTGVSSPWVQSYVIAMGVPAADQTWTYDVTFAEATSSGSAGEVTVKVTVKQQDDKWVIDKLASMNGSFPVGSMDGR